MAPEAGVRPRWMESEEAMRFVWRTLGGEVTVYEHAVDVGDSDNGRLSGLVR